MRGYRPLDAVKLKVIETVDCGTCPVTMACAVEKGGNGYTYSCCGSTGFLMERPDGVELLMIDCGKHNFEQNDQVVDMPECPLCSGNALAIELLGLGTPARWLPTVHAQIPASVRLETFRKALPEAEELAARVQKRKAAK